VNILFLPNGHVTGTNVLTITTKMTISQQVPFRFIACILASLLIVACEEPQTRSKPAADEVSLAEAPLAGFKIPEAIDAPAVTSTSVPEAPAEDLAPVEPELIVTMEGKKITIRGAVKSSIQHERIVKDMTDAFPEFEIVNEFKLEYHRMPVGWGNRVSEGFLVPYFQQVKSPKVAYREGIVTLAGEVADTRMHRFITELAIEMFSGSYTKNIDNRITVGK